MAQDAPLRPLERRVLRLAGDGHDEVDMARRFRRSPEHMRRVLDLARIPRHPQATPSPAELLRPLERRLLKWREQGADHAEIAAMFRRGPDFIRRVEALAQYKRAKRAEGTGTN